jgi:hypothetical protein
LTYFNDFGDESRNFGVGLTLVGRLNMAEASVASVQGFRDRFDVGCDVGDRGLPVLHKCLWERAGQ